MKVYLAYVDQYDYDEYDGVVLVAENEDRALEIVKTGRYCGQCFGRCGYFEKHQGEIHIEEVDLTEEGVVLESYNAG